MRVCTPSPMPTLAQPPVAAAYVNYFGRLTKVRGSIVVSISACHAEDPGSIPVVEITTAHGAAHGDDAVVRMLRTVMSCVAHGSGLSGCPWRRLVKINR